METYFRPDLSEGETMKDRFPTEFETRVLKRIDNGRGLLAGDGQVAISAACRRLEKLGYAAHPGTRWYVTTKGDEYLASIKAAEQSVKRTAGQMNSPRRR